MQNRPAFGRRGTAQHRSPAQHRMKSAPASRAPAAHDAAFEDALADAYESDPVSPPAARTDPVDAELEEWKRGRKKLPLFAWRPLYFMASICFGLASFVLPDSINNVVQWPLYALAAMSFIVGMKMRREKRAARKAAKLEAAQSSL